MDKKQAFQILEQVTGIDELRLSRGAHRAVEQALRVVHEVLFPEEYQTPSAEETKVSELKGKSK
jgi:hypothetical protein